MLNELWNSPHEWTENYGNYNFTIDGVSYFAKFKDKTPYFKDDVGEEFIQKLVSNGDYGKFDDTKFLAYEFFFGHRTSRGDGNSYKIKRSDGMKKANAINVLSTVVAIFKDAVESEGRPQVVYFDGEGKRMKVYDKLVKHLAKSVGYKYVILKWTGVKTYILYRV